jgi:membrane fusion protein, multidrug efflux system
MRKTWIGFVALVGLGFAAVETGYFGQGEQLAERFPAVKQLAEWLPGMKGRPGEATGGQARAQAPPAVAVEVAKAVRKATPVILEALGNVTTIASVALRPRLDDEIVGVHFQDGAFVKQGDLLLTLDARAIEAQLAQAQGNLARDQAQLAGANRDLRRNSDLMAKGAGPQLNVENSKTQSDAFLGNIKADEAAVENLKVQLSYTKIYAPISGRISQAAVKVGNFARMADTVPIATINQIAPLYVTFSVAQRDLPELRLAISEGKAPVEVTIPGDARRAKGTVTMSENAIDPTSGLVLARATMPNEDELLWPGTLVTARVTLRTEEAVVVPSAAVQVSQQGNLVFVVKDNVATVALVKVRRSLGDETVLDSGVEDGDVVVTDGHLRLNNGSRVSVRERKAGA